MTNLPDAENLGVTNLPDTVPVSDTDPSKCDKYTYIYIDKTLNLSEPIDLDNVVIPPEINKGDFSYFSDDGSYRRRS